LPQVFVNLDYKLTNFDNKVVFEILKKIQPAKPGDIALKLYEIGEYDPNFHRARNSANAALTNGKKAGKWKLLRRGVYVLNDYPESFQRRRD
jgi:hypothetical protein